MSDSDGSMVDGRGTEDPPNALIAFDNSGTLSRVTSVETAVVSGSEWASPVPDAPITRGRVALLSIDHEHVHRCAVDLPLGTVVESHEIPVHLALSNCDVSPAEARTALVRDRETAARTVVEHVERAVAATDGEPIAGAQVVVDLAACAVLRVFGYTATPLPEASGVVDWTRRHGYQPHIVSGDTGPILARVAESIGIDGANVHPYQSATDKRETVESLRERTGLPVVMVGDYVNDRYAFEAADLAVFIDDEESEKARELLAGRADLVIPHLDALPDALADYALID